VKAIGFDAASDEVLRLGEVLEPPLVPLPGLLGDRDRARPLAAEVAGEPALGADVDDDLVGGGVAPGRLQVGVADLLSEVAVDNGAQVAVGDRRARVFRLN
jgi:hypothetical protein